MENKSSAQFAYQATQISTATKEQLLLITYDIGIRSCRLAETALEEGEGHPQDIDLANREIIRAQDVIRELMVTLNTNCSWRRTSKNSRRTSAPSAPCWRSSRALGRRP